MRRLIAATVIASFASYATSAIAQSHLVSLALAEEQLTEARAHRSQDVATILGLLAHPDVSEALASIHIDSQDLGARASTLSDAELQDLAERAARLEVDPRATGVGKGLLIAFAIIVVALVLGVAICSTGGGGGCEV